MAEPPAVYTIPAGVPFVDALAAGLMDQAGTDALGLADTTVLLPNRRACRALRDAFLRAGQGRTLILPRLSPIGDVDEDELDVADAWAGFDDVDLPPAMAPLRRQLLLAKLLVRAGPALGTSNVDRATRLAAELARLLDEVETNRVDLAGLRRIVPAAYAEHWQKSLRFLAILTNHWPRLLAAEGRLDPAERRNRLLEALAQRWRAAPPKGRVVAAGSTGSIPATADLLATIAALPNGAIVLPGLDLDADDATWAAIGDSHPQAASKRLLERLGLARADVRPWPVATGAPVGRFRVLGEALRPAETIAAWPGLPKPDFEALAGLSRVVCPTPQVEAGVVALAMRMALERPGATAALVTRDRDLARRVAAELGRWGLAVDDSAGTPLATTPAGACFRLALALAEQGGPVALLALLKHPLVAGGRDPASFRSDARVVERLALRGPRPAPGFKGLDLALGAAGASRALRARVRRIGRAAAPFLRAIEGRRVRPRRVLEAHVRFCEWLAASAAATGAGRLWSHDDGEALAGFVAELADAADALGTIRGSDYAGLVDSLLAGRVVRPRHGRHPRLFIWGPLEARLQRADVMILGGLNEGTWPALPEPDPWLSRPMRAEFGVPPSERRIGLAALDFVQGAAAPTVLLTRSAKVDGSPTVPSRWLVRLETFLAAHGLDDHLDSQAELWLGWQANLDRPTRVAPMAPPLPTPPVARRPRRLSVTGVETWLRDPYAIFARRVLGLEPLDPLDADPGAAERGQFIHAALDAFVTAWPAELPDDAYERLLAFGEAAFGAALGRPAVRAFWWPRFERVARWFVDHERERRADGRRPRSEITGSLRIAAGAGPFELTAKADRLDVAEDGGLAIVDYKTGARPSRKDVERGIAPQLALEAAIAAAGGFPGVPAGAVRELEFWHLTGDDPPARVIAPKAPAETLAREAERGLRRLIERFDEQATPYLVCPRPDVAPAYNDFEHLERGEEWDGGGGEVPAYRPPPPPGPGTRPPPALPDQRRMSDPATSAWVGASAGTGKTKVLTDRVLRLLLAGSPPGRLLCLTFTKAAAAEMATRIERRLGAWAIAAPEVLVDDLTKLTGADPDEATVARARRLFADTLEAPGGLPIMTIHAFCQALLARFPVEAAVLPGFEVADERTARELQGEALAAIIERSRADPALGRHIGTLARLAQDSTVRSVVEQLIDARGRFRGLIRRHGGVEAAQRAAWRASDLAPGETVESLVAGFVEPAAIDEPNLRMAAALLGGGAPADARLGAAILDLLAARPARRAERFDGYRRLFLTAEEAPRRRLVSADHARAYPRAVGPLESEQARVASFAERRNRIVTAEVGVALLGVGAAVLDAYAARKAAHGVLDYEDLVLAAADLVTRPGIAPWVLYKLDGGIDHVLVDEAQDTSPDQWRIIAALADEFFAGEGARDLARTLFVVGDEKQSIFSFQGADLDGLARVHDGLRARALAAAAPWLELDMTLSFRSAAPILQAVDAVFAGDAGKGVAPVGRGIAHRPSRAEAAGLVEVWPPAVPSGDAEGFSAWDVPTAYRETDDPASRLARHIAATIAGWIDCDVLESQDRQVRPGDVMVLLRRRDRLLHDLVRELRRRHVPVAGVDRMVLNEPLAVRDLIALARFALLPDDDLTLAAVLKGPLLDFDDQALIALTADRRRGESLWSALNRRARRDARFERARDWLARLHGTADFAPPHGFLAGVLGAPAACDAALSGRAAMLRRLGLEAEDPIDELLSLALTYERRHAPSLEGFAHWLGRTETEIKRDLEHGRDEVRVITVHGAKGLEAPIVILPDTTRPPVEHGATLLWDEAGDGGLLWSGRAAFAEQRVRAAKEARDARQQAEYRRLLYVALTRAADRLYVGGWVGRDAPHEGSWYRLVRDALAPIAARVPFEAWPGDALRLESRAVVARAPPPAPRFAVAPQTPPWMREPAPVEAPVAPPLAPSRAPAEPPAQAPFGAGAGARTRGRAIHRLLELLPGVPAGSRAAIAERVLARRHPDLAPEARADLALAAIRVIESPGLANLFGPDSRAEVPLVGVVGERVVAGQVDRLVVGAAEIVVGDYKSDRAPPADAAGVPPAYRRQLALYGALLREVFPGRRVRAILVWTEGPTVMELPDSEAP
ncbi:MAG: double-strand break repair helicase AddA [Alphaproteobacteria bacterium]